MNNVDFRQPFIQLILQCAIITIVGILIVSRFMRILASDLSRPLFVPIGTAIFCGSLALLAETKRRRYASAVLGLLSAVVLFPGLALAILRAFHIPPHERTADLIALIPQGIVAPSFFQFFRRRFENVAE